MKQKNKLFFHLIYRKILLILFDHQIKTDYDNYNENLSLAEKISERLNKEVSSLTLKMTTLEKVL